MQIYKTFWNKLTLFRIILNKDLTNNPYLYTKKHPPNKW